MTGRNFLDSRYSSSASSGGDSYSYGSNDSYHANKTPISDSATIIIKGLPTHTTEPTVSDVLNSSK